jgi:hypothetical protein
LDEWWVSFWRGTIRRWWELHGWRAASEREGYAWSEAVKSGIEERGEGPLGVVGTEMGPCDEPPPARDWVSWGYIVTTNHDRTSS